MLLRASRQHITTRLAHVVLLLHGGVLLVLGKGQGERQAKEDGRRGDDPGGLAAEREGGPAGAGDGAGAVGEPAAGLGGDNVAQGVQALGERLVLGVKVGVVGNLRLCSR